MTMIRPPAIAGMFYPKEGRTAGQQAMEMVVKAANEAGVRDGLETPKAIIAPHAGWKYSGPCAAAAYARLLPARETVTRIVLLGPCHRVLVQGLATSSADHWQTPLGAVPIDRNALAEVRDLAQILTSDAAHREEHSLEVHLPFLQVCFPKLTLVPFVVGVATPEQVAEVLERLWGGPETRIVISSDLSHFLDYDACNRRDADTAAAVERFDYAGIGSDQACGRVPMSGLLHLAKRDGMTIERVGLCNSGDTAGDKSRVVGYGSWVLH